MRKGHSKRYKWNGSWFHSMWPQCAGATLTIDRKKGPMLAMGSPYQSPHSQIQLVTKIYSSTAHFYPSLEMEIVCSLAIRPLETHDLWRSIVYDEKPCEGLCKHSLHSDCERVSLLLWELTRTLQNWLSGLCRYIAFIKKQTNQQISLCLR